MYLLLLIAALGLGIGLFIRGGLRRNRAAMVAGAAVLFFVLLDFWAEMLWFEAAGYPLPPRTARC